MACRLDSLTSGESSMWQNKGGEYRSGRVCSVSGYPTCWGVFSGRCLSHLSLVTAYVFHLYWRRTCRQNTLAGIIQPLYQPGLQWGRTVWGLTRHSALWIWGHMECLGCCLFWCWSFFLYLEAERWKTIWTRILKIIIKVYFFFPPMPTFQDMLPLYCDVQIPILAGVFMVQPQSVHDLMAKVPHCTDIREVQLLFSSLTTNIRCTTKERMQKNPYLHILIKHLKATWAISTLTLRSMD